jgi:hypothetical protein
VLMRLACGWTRSGAFLQQAWSLGQEGTFVLRAGATVAVVAGGGGGGGGGIGYC